MIHVNHSIPDAVGLAIRCPAGVIIQTGDFKIDTTPVDGDMIDLSRFAEYGRKGVLALLSDSTNAERPGYTPSEKSVGDSFENLFRKANKRESLLQLSLLIFTGYSRLLMLRVHATVRLPL